MEIEGEKVDNPDDYKGDPIPGGPTDPSISDARAYGEPDLTDETSVDVKGQEGSKESDEGDSDGADESGGDDEDRQEGD